MPLLIQIYILEYVTSSIEFYFVRLSKYFLQCITFRLLTVLFSGYIPVGNLRWVRDSPSLMCSSFPSPECWMKRTYASCPVFASHCACFVYLFVWLVVALSCCASSSCPLVPPRHAALRRVGASRLVSSSCLVFASRLIITSLLVASCRAHFFW